MILLAGAAGPATATDQRIYGDSFSSTDTLPYGDPSTKFNSYSFTLDSGQEVQYTVRTTGAGCIQVFLVYGQVVDLATSEYETEASTSRCVGSYSDSWSSADSYALTVATTSWDPVTYTVSVEISQGSVTGLGSVLFCMIFLIVIIVIVVVVVIARRKRSFVQSAYGGAPVYAPPSSPLPPPTYTPPGGQSPPPAWSPSQQSRPGMAPPSPAPSSVPSYAPPPTSYTPPTSPAAPSSPGDGAGAGAGSELIGDEPPPPVGYDDAGPAAPGAGYQPPAYQPPTYQAPVYRRPGT